MGAGCGNGPGRLHDGHEAAAEGRRLEERLQPELRDEHAEDDQRVRHRGMARRCLIILRLAAESGA